jgi:hypothetical protein
MAALTLRANSRPEQVQQTNLIEDMLAAFDANLAVSTV